MIRIMCKVWFKSIEVEVTQSLMIRIMCKMWSESNCFNFWFAFVQNGSNLDLWLIRIKHQKSQIFKILRRLWDFSFYLTWINIIYGSYSSDSCNWLKASWSSLILTNGLCMLKTNLFPDLIQRREIMKETQ